MAFPLIDPAILDTDLAWAAGIIDGEGCILLNIDKKRNVYTPRIHVTNTDAKMLLKLKGMFGGNIYAARHKNDKAHWKPRWMWVVLSQHAITVVALLLPYLVTKKDQAEIFIEFSNTRRQRGNNESLAVKESNALLLDKQSGIYLELQRMKRQPEGMPEAGGTNGISLLN